MTAGNPEQLLLRFTVPTMIGNLLHQVYSITDSMIVGRVLGQSSLAAIGCTAPIIMLLAALMVGVNVGVSILLSQMYGKHDMAAVRRAFANSLYIGAVIAVLLAGAGFLLAEPILRWMNTPEAALREAVAYPRISFLTTFCPLLYYLLSCAFRGMGAASDSMYGGVIQLGVKVAVILAGAYLLERLPAVWAVWPLSFGVSAVYLFHRYRKTV